jgi:hypothetical protein
MRSFIVSSVCYCRRYILDKKMKYSSKFGGTLHVKIILFVPFNLLCPKTYLLFATRNNSCRPMYLNLQKRRERGKMESEIF